MSTNEKWLNGQYDARFINWCIWDGATNLVKEFTGQALGAVFLHMRDKEITEKIGDNLVFC